MRSSFLKAFCKKGSLLPSADATTHGVVVLLHGLLPPFVRPGWKPGLVGHLKCEDPERNLLGKGINTLLEVHLARAGSYDNKIVCDTIWTRVTRRPV